MKDSGLSIFKYVLLGFAITTALIGIVIGVEHTSGGHRVELFAFELLQGQLSPFNPEEELPVVVVDISDIKESKDKEVIDLEKLKEVVRAIAEQKPRAIAIDVVLTPEPDVENQKDPSETNQKKLEGNYFEFLDFCLQKIKQEKGIPIFLSVGKRTADKPEEWLGSEKYKEMAATLIIPKAETTRIPIWFKASPESEKLYSLSANLAKAYQRVHLPNSFAWAVESADEGFPSTERHLQGNMEYADALVNYSKLEAIQQNKLLTISETSIKEAGEKFSNRMVILGDGTKEKAVDTFIVAGRKETVSGVYLHASAAYTFAREPMYEFKFLVRLFLDLFLTGLIILIVAFARYQHLGERKVFNWRKRQNWLILIFLLGICVLAFLLVRFTGILWLDFLLVMLALWLHPKVEAKFSKSK
jgi:CHASE2 domain-containing sensor protein